MWSGAECGVELSAEWNCVWSGAECGVELSAEWN